MQLTLETYILVCIAFGGGGILKGATGTGAPFLAVPIMTLMVDVSFAVAVFLLPNIASNTYQIIRYRRDLPNGWLAWAFALSAMVGATIGTFLLAEVNAALLSKVLAAIVFLYIVFRLGKPQWKMPHKTADFLAVPVGGVAGIFQGAVGLSGPISITFMNAVPLARPQFIAVMSLFFLAMAVAQLPAQMALGIMNLERLVYGVFAVVPLGLGMLIGDRLGRRISKTTFDFIILGVLGILGVQLLY